MEELKTWGYEVRKQYKTTMKKVELNEMKLDSRETDYFKRTKKIAKEFLGYFKTQDTTPP